MEMGALLYIIVSACGCYVIIKQNLHPLRRGAYGKHQRPLFYPFILPSVILGICKILSLGAISNHRCSDMALKPATQPT